MRGLGWAAGAICLALMTGGAAAYDAVSVDGAIVCSYPGQYREAELAVRAGDSQWLKSSGCVTIKAGVKLTVITPGNQYQSLSQVRLIEPGVTAYMGRWHYVPFGGIPSSAMTDGKPMSVLTERLRLHLTKCAGNYVKPPEAYTDYAVVFFVHDMAGQPWADVERFAPSSKIDEFPALLEFAAGAFSAFKKPECYKFSDREAASALKKTGSTYVLVRF